MTEKEVVERLAKRDPTTQLVGLVKQGLWYREGAHGYTAYEKEAGRFTREEAKKYEYLRGDADERVTIREFSKPDWLNSRDALAPVVEGMTKNEWHRLAQILEPPIGRLFALRKALTIPPRDLAFAIAEALE